MVKRNEKNKDFFWLSYSDLMTSLFFVMLILFILFYTIQNRSIVALNMAKEELSIKVEEYERLQQVERHMKQLRSNSSFVYLPECKKYVVKDLIGEEIFYPNKTTIKEQFIDKTINAGKEIEKFLSILSQDKSLSFLLVIEGNMANFYDKRMDENNKIGYQYSYDRALAVHLLWVNKGIDLRKYNTEIIIAGSGFSGLCREATEENNKRFSIQIFPKIGEKN